jgi:hypothetical protein
MFLDVNGGVIHSPAARAGDGEATGIDGPILTASSLRGEPWL